MPKKGEKKQGKNASAKTTSKKSAASARVRKVTKPQVKQKNKKMVRARKSLINSFRLSWRSLVFIKNFWRPLLGIVLVYSLLNFILASGLLSNASSVVDNFHSAKVSDALNSFSEILSGGSNQAATMQTVLFILESLVIIWALRHLFSKEQIKVKQAYYHSTTPLIPFVIVLFVIVLQLLPITLSSAAFAIVMTSITGNALVEIIFTSLFIASAFWSCYMLCSSIFALYIVTLPNMQPRAALKSAKNLVHYRRWQVVRKLLFLPVFLVLTIGIFIVPLILYIRFLAAPAFFILSMLSILFAHTYLYTLYKGLLENE
jgi:hypothetical protein